MKLCDVTLGSPEENLACEEALLDLCEGGRAPELLRFWMPPSYFVVVGYANPIATEVNLPFCESAGIGVFRRCTGGGTVLQGPGCLNYALILDNRSTPELRGITSTNRYILERMRKSLAKLLGKAVEAKGHTDLAVGQVKFCGNAQRRKKHFLLFHGSLLLDMDIGMIEQTLPMPSKQPDYRENRSHSGFLMNLDIGPEPIKAAIAEEWQANESFEDLPLSEIERLVREKYATQEWNRRF